MIGAVPSSASATPWVLRRARRAAIALPVLLAPGQVPMPEIPHRDWTSSSGQDPAYQPWRIMTLGMREWAHGV